MFLLIFVCVCVWGVLVICVVRVVCFVCVCLIAFVCHALLFFDCGLFVRVGRNVSCFMLV